MVLQPSYLDDSPLALLRLARSEADAELRKSLVRASMFALTLAVAVLLVRALFFGAPDFRIIEPPVILPPINFPLPPVIPTGQPAPPKVAAPNTQGIVIPVDPDIPSEQEKLAPPTGPVTDATHGDGPVGNNATVPGPAVITPPSEPLPGDFVVTENLPVPVLKVKPDYPPIAMQAGMEGKVLVRMLIGLDGHVRRAEIERSSAMFDEEALKAARQWTFTPATTDGRPVMVWVRVPFDFRLR